MVRAARGDDARDRDGRVCPLRDSESEGACASGAGAVEASVMVSIAALLPATALTRYDDDGEPELRAGERVLMVLRRLGWVTRAEINEALGLVFEWHDDAARGALDAVTIGIRDGVRSGKIERRVINRERRYRLNVAAFATGRPCGRLR